MGVCLFITDYGTEGYKFESCWAYFFIAAIGVVASIAKSCHSEPNPFNNKSLRHRCLAALHQGSELPLCHLMPNQLIPRQMQGTIQGTTVFYSEGSDLFSVSFSLTLGSPFGDSPFGRASTGPGIDLTALVFSSIPMWV